MIDHGETNRKLWHTNQQHKQKNGLDILSSTTNHASSYHLKDGRVYFQDHLLDESADWNSLVVIDEYHAKDKEHVYSFTSIIPNADPTTFQLLTAPMGELVNRYSKDKHSVFFECNKITDADPQTFEVLDEFHGKDKNSVYLCGSIFEYVDVDIKNFKGLGASYSKDKSHVYYYGKVLKHADPKTFIVFDPNYWGTYSKDKYTVFSHSGRALTDVDVESFTPVKGKLYGYDKDKVYNDTHILSHAVPESLTIINDYFVHDGTRVYCQDKEIVGADADSFSVLTNAYGNYFSKDKNHIYFKEKIYPTLGCVDSFNPLNFEYCKDDTAVYYEGDVIEDVDLQTFSVIFSDYARDSNSVYYAGEKQLNIDPNSFEIFSELLSVDKNNVYYMMEKVENLDPNTLEQIGGKYIKDTKYVVYIDERFGELDFIDGADSTSFTILDKGYAKDDHNVYHCASRLPLCESESFEIIKSQGAYAKDRSHIYYADSLIKSADVDTFECIDYQFSKDKNSIYIFGKQIENSDPETFHFMDLPYVENRPNYAMKPEFAKDKNNVYINGCIIEGAHAESFELISTWYSKDKNRIYCDGVALALNPNQAVLLSDLYIRDEITVFYSSHVIEQADPQSVVVISNSCHLIKDSKNVYFRQNILEGADSESFYIINDGHCRDKNYDYIMQQGKWIVSN